jgi:hypothetical protein
MISQEARSGMNAVLEARSLTKVYRMGEVDVHALRGVELEVIGGLSPGDRVVLHPGERLRDGVVVEARTP